MKQYDKSGMPLTVEDARWWSSHVSVRLFTQRSGTRPMSLSERSFPDMSDYRVDSLPGRIDTAAMLSWLPDSARRWLDRHGAITHVHGQIHAARQAKKPARVFLEANQDRLRMVRLGS